MSARARGGTPTKRLKYAVQLRRARVEGEVEERPYVGLENIEPETGKLLANGTTDGQQNEIESLGNAFEPGDVLFGKLRPYLAKVWLADFAGRCTGELLVMQPKEFDSRFLRAVCLNRDFIDAVDGSTFGSKMPRADWDFIGNMRVPVPPMPEQRAIADFLDRETARLDALVAAKARWLELLAEKRRALITRAVTRGLNPAAPLRDSGLPWLGQIPKHWQAKRLRHISDFITVGVVVNPSSYVTDEGVPFLLGGDIREMRIDISNSKRCSPESSDGPLLKTRLDAGDVVVVRVGYPGVAAVVPPELEGGNVASMMLVRKHARYCSEWLAYAFNTPIGRDQVEIVQYGAAQKQFNISHAVDFAFPFPPLDEQRAIVAHVSAATAKLDALRAATERTIGLLQERRAALIAAAVTGKIEVSTGKH